VEAAPQVVVISADAELRGFLRTFLSERSYEPIAFGIPDEAVQFFRLTRPDAVILELASPAPDALQAIVALKQIDRRVPILVLSKTGCSTSVLQAMKLGAAEFIGNPFDGGALEAPIADALTQRRLSRAVALLREQLRSHGSPGHLLISSAPRMAPVREFIERVAEMDIALLIHGERGVGKDVLARAIHAASLRRDKPFMKVNCDTIAPGLLESDLFGFERGVFARVLHPRVGKFEFANHGTMFLDEIGAMPLPLQTKLLRLLQGGRVARLGGTIDIPIDVRVIAATSQDLDAAVQAAEFRPDLLVRLRAASIRLPPLRERLEDLSELSDVFLKTFAVQYNKPFPQLSSELMALFREYSWPGNLRELESAIRRVVVLGDEAPIRTELRRALAKVTDRTSAPALPFGQRGGASASPLSAAAATLAGVAERSCSLKEAARAAAREAERVLILKMLQRTRWNRKAAAGILGISYKALLYKIKASGLDKALSPS
jgi:DNA-binding NtrC family response regulator